jgi:hypothetical protein
LLGLSYLPKALGGVFTAGALEDLGAARVLSEELCHIVDGAIDNDPEPFFFGLVLGDLSGCVLFRHFVGSMARSAAISELVVGWREEWWFVDAKDR